MMKKRGLSILLTLALALTILPTGAWAAQLEPAEEAAVLACAPDADACSENDELFSEYAAQVFYGSSQLTSGRIGPIGEATLTGGNLWLYHWLKGEIVKIANGTLGSSEFEIDATGMGISCAGGSLNGIDTGLVIDALLADCPYELYWYDKKNSTKISYMYGSLDYIVTSITIKFPVAQNYAVTNDADHTYYLYRPDTAKTGAAVTAARNAQAVVNSCSGLSDYDKLAAYRDYICGQVSYNHTAADNDDYPYGDPWQLIYVFDNDPNTNVVCEGYSKAFKYLCDLTSFSNQVDCYTVSGYTTGDHMWNIVRINGESYLTDITNSDEGMTGQHGGLFLAGAPNSTVNGATIHIPRHDLEDGRYYEAKDRTYTYKADTIALYGASILTLASSNYAPDMLFTDLSPSGFYLDAVAWAVEQGVTAGTTNTTFSPDQYCTHGQILTFLWRAAGKPQSGAVTPFALTGSEYYYDAAKWAYERGMIGADFNPDTPCTRAWAVLYIWQAFGGPAAVSANPFSDVPSDGTTAAAVAWAVGNDITTGTSPTTFTPDKVCTRGEIVTFLHRAYT